MECPFAFLGLEPTVTIKEIDKKYKQMMLRSHPDKAAVGDAMVADQQAKLLNEAREKAKELRVEAIKQRAYQFWRTVDRSDEEKYAVAVDEFMMDPSIQEILDCIYEYEEEADRVKAISMPGVTIMGYDYGLWNPLFGDLMKLGATRRQPYMRCEELSRCTGVPEPFQLITFLPTTNPFALEREIHAHFASVRKYGRKKEFFLLSRSAVIDHFQTLTERAIVLPPSSNVSQSEQDEDKSTSAKKRKHRRVYMNQEENDAFKDVMSQFVKSRIQLDNFASVTSRYIMKAFMDNGHQVPSELLFFAELRNQVDHMFPTAVSKRVCGVWGYKGISLK